MTALKARDVMEILGVTRTRAYEIMRECTHLRFGKSIRVFPADFAKWCERNAQASAPSDVMLPEVPAPDGASVYAVQAGSLVKIGKATNIARRVRQLKGANAEAVRLVAVLSPHPDDESRIHSHLVVHRHHGEWFRMEGRVAAAIAEARR